MTKKIARPTKKIKTRPPIVTIMGHVDHGKTTLLDAIRQSKLVASEHGGITQHIGAYQITHDRQLITFIDTPGHAAFVKMRQRGADVTDIAVLVVAADDGVKPQTIESIKHIKTAAVPCIVAINKIDKPSATGDMVKAQLAEHQVFVEGYGGQTPVVEISALKHTGIDNLLEMILLVAQLEELPAKPDHPLSAVVIESNLEKNKGPMATVIIKTGTLKLTDSVFIDRTEHKIRAMFNDLGKSVKTAGPGDPVAILGLKRVPPVGSIITSIPTDTPTPPAPTPTADDPDTTEDQETVKRPEFNLILKADTAGTLEAVIQSVLQDEITLIASGIGPITEADVLLAQSTRSLVIGFNVPITASAEKLAQIERVNIQRFNIIYKLIEFLEEKVLTLIEPTINEVDLGTAEVKAIFNIRGQLIAGCQVTAGKVDKQFPIHLMRKNKIIKDARIHTLKQGKEDVKVVKAGSECGIVFKPPIDFKIGDIFKSYKTLEE